jgi:3-dehydroquinate dehydratase/shikimate dehydrogenase
LKRGDDALPGEAGEHRLALCLMKNSPAKICVPVCVEHASELPEAIGRAAAMADVIELRLDYLADNERGPALAILRDWFGRSDQAVIITLRSAEQGGRSTLDQETRRRFWISLMDLSQHALFDLELDLVLGFAASAQIDGSSIDWSRVICSHHNFDRVPSGLDQIYESMAATPARVLKVAVQANDATDCLPVFRLLERAHGQDREMIAIAMGQAGIMTRVLGPSRGSFLTYGSLDNLNANAPGQLTAEALREVFRIGNLNQETEVFGLIGNPVGHSVSPQIHNAGFGAAGLNAVYLPFEVRDVDGFMTRMARPCSRELDWNVRGLSVTAPHKAAVINSLDWIHPTAQAVGAVNTIVIGENEMRGYNTDVAGFLQPLKQKLGPLRDVRCAIIGAGGGARAALWALLEEGADAALFVRDESRISEASARLAVRSYPISAASFAGFDVVVNATPVGTRGALEDQTLANADQFRGVRLAYDLVYNPLETRFLREARAAGCETLGGIEMLLAQANAQFKLWTGKDADGGIMRSAALRSLGF